MRDCNAVGISPCDEPSTGRIWTNLSSALKVHMDFWRYMISAAWVHALLFDFASNSSIRAGVFVSLLFRFVWLPGRELLGCSWSRYSVPTSPYLLASSIRNTGRASSRLAL